MSKPRKCRACREPYSPSNSLQQVCSPGCALALVDKEKQRKAAQEAKEQRAWVRKQKEALKTRREWLKDAQREFNKFVRARDHSEPCICCGQWGPDEAWKPGGQWDAGHYLSVGSHPELRFNEDNCHKQLKSCNAGAGKYTRKNHTVSQEYRERLIQKIGIDKVEALEGPNPAQHYTIDELKAITAYYRKAARELEQQRKAA